MRYVATTHIYDEAPKLEELAKVEDIETEVEGILLYIHRGTTTKQIHDSYGKQLLAIEDAYIHCDEANELEEQVECARDQAAANVVETIIHVNIP